MSRLARMVIGALLTLVVVAVIALVVAFTTNSGEGEAAVDPLAATRWQVQSLYNPGERPGMSSPWAGTSLTADFADGTVSGSAGCNDYTAGYKVDADALSISQPAATKRVCDQPAGIMDQEAAYLQAMASAAGYLLEGEKLRIYNSRGLVVVDFVPSAPQAEVTQPPAADDSWERVRAAGRIVVGTAADTPPFVYYVGPAQIDGFDIALMDEIGRRLGVQVEYHDLAFDGLSPALRLGQIDAAIAAIPHTPARQAQMDLTAVYLVSEGGILARQEADITVIKIDDLAKYKVGVQRGGAYEQWAHTVLIDAGRMSADNLLVYEKAEDALQDLREGDVDVVILDVQAAQAFVEQGGVKLVAKGLNERSYAIALRQGAASLKAEIDRVITALYNDGFIAGLAQQYLGMPGLLPTPTPRPTSTPGPTPACDAGLTLVKHLTDALPGTMVPGQAFSKGWQVQNSGTCPWSATDRLVFVDGDRMGGEPLAVGREVRPGETYDLQITLVAPLIPGSYQGLWQMQTAQGVGFGERLRVTIEVAAP